MLYCGSIMFGRCAGTTGPFANRNLTIQDVFEAIGAYNAGKISREQFRDVEDHACPGAGACGGQFTANTMATAYEMLGISPMGWNDVPAVDPRKEEIAFECGKLVMGLVKKGITPRSIVTRKSFENAIAGVMATGGSTNAVLHLPATAKDFGVKLSIEDFDRISTQDAGGGGPQAMGHLHRARDVRGGRHGGGGQAARSGGAHSRRASKTVTGRTIGAEIKRGGRAGAARRSSSRSPRRSRPTGGIAILRGNLAPGGCVIKLSGQSRYAHRGPARVFEREEDAFKAVKDGKIMPNDVIVIRYEGPKGGPGMREMLHVTGALQGAGLGDTRGADDRRALLRAPPTAS